MTTARPRKRGCAYFLRLGLVAFVGILFAYNCVFPVYLSYVLVHKRIAPCCSTPSDWGMDYEDVTFTTDDGLLLSGWYVPSRNRAAIITVHGSNGNRTGTLEHAAMLARHGYGVLLFDLRGCGESEGERFTLGWDANRDVAAALGYLQDRPDVDGARIGILGLSMGGEVALQAAAQLEQINAVVSDGAGFRTFDDFWAIPDAGKLLSAPFIWMQFTAHGLFAQVAPPAPLLELIPRIAPKPMLLISSGRGNPGEVKLTSLYYAVGGEPKTMWDIPEAGHTGGLAARPQEYEERVVGFLDRALLSEL